MICESSLSDKLMGVNNLSLSEGRDASLAST